MKKFLFGFIVSVLTFTFVSCGNGTKKAETTEAVDVVEVVDSVELEEVADTVVAEVGDSI